MTVFIYIDFEKKIRSRRLLFERSVTAAPWVWVTTAPRSVLVHKYHLLPRLQERLHLDQELVEFHGFDKVEAAVLVRLLEALDVFTLKHHRLVLPVEQFNDAHVIRVVEFLLRLEHLVLVQVIDKAREVLVRKLSEPVPPLRQGKVNHLTLGGVLEGDCRKLDCSHLVEDGQEATEVCLGCRGHTF